MKLQDQVTSLKLSKKLKSLNVKQESLFYWVNCIAGIEGIRKWRLEQPKDVEDFDTASENKVFSAFTCSELGEMLPLKVEGERLQLWREKDRESWDVAYNTCPTSNGKQEIWEQAKTEASARAKMLIYLLENNLINKLKKK